MHQAKTQIEQFRCSASRRAARALASYRRPAYVSETRPSSIASPTALSRRPLWPGGLFSIEARTHRVQALLDVIERAGPLPPRVVRKVARAIAPTGKEIMRNAEQLGAALTAQEVDHAMAAAADELIVAHAAWMNGSDDSARPAALGGRKRP